MLHTPTPTIKDLRILAPEFRDLIAQFPDTLETAATPDVVVNFMRALPPRPYEDIRITKIDIQISIEDALSTQPPTSVRLYIPKDGATKRSLPVVLWLHHGGFFSAGPARIDPFCSAIAVGAGVVVVAPAYRQTPEHPFPAAFEDAYQALIWLASSSDVAQYSIDPHLIAIGGTSAGGTLAMGMALRYRDEGCDTSKIRLLLLDDTSVTNCPTSYSTFHNPVNKIWNANITRFMWQLYLPNGPASLEGPMKGYAVPSLAEKLGGIPPTLVLCAQWDDLTNDTIAFAHRLLESGVPTEIHIYRGTFHASDKLVHDAKASIKKRQDIINALQAAFA